MQQCFCTARLRIDQISRENSLENSASFFSRTQAILSPAVVENLPPYFHHIDSASAAQVWFERMQAESHFYPITHLEHDELAGFLFVFNDDAGDDSGEAHIGYLLAENYWGMGLASELLAGFIAFAEREKRWKKLLGGVDPANTASAHLLQKLGFQEQAHDGDGDGAVFYAYTLT